MRWLAVLLTCLTSPLTAEVTPVPYDTLARELSTTLTFETLPSRPEPGFNLDHPLRFTGIWLGEHFAGQSITQRPAATGTPHDILGQTAAHRPLAIRPGPRRQNLSVAHHRGFASNALLPLGPHGFDTISGRGEGAVAILFDHDQFALGFRVHTDYAKPLGTAPRGTLTVTFMTRMGHVLDQHTLHPGPSITSYGFRTSDTRARIGGILITNSDPGGIALDDILFQIERMLF